MVQIHIVKATIKKKAKKRIGRGGKRGTYAGKGLKGQKSRAGAKIRPQTRDIIKKLPKLRGYKMKVRRKNVKIVNIKDIEKHFKTGEEVSPKTLVEKGVLKKSKGKLPKVKILSMGELKKKIIVKDCDMSEAAKKKIEKAGGKILESSK